VLDQVSHDEDAEIVDVPFAYEVRERRELIRQGLIRQRWRNAMRKALLRFRGVTGTSIDDPSRIGMYTLDGLSFDAVTSQVHLATAEGLRISMDVARVDAELQLRPDAAGEKVVSYFFWIIESESLRDVRLDLDRNGAPPGH